MQVRGEYLKKQNFSIFSLNGLIKYFFLFLLLSIVELPVLYAQDPVVYSRCERTHKPFDLTAEVTVNGQTQTVTRTMTGLDIYDILPDVTNFFGKFSAPCDLVYRDPDGVETIIFDCSSTSTDVASCAALDAAVSFDGDTIAFSVFRGNLVNKREKIHSQVVHPDAEPENLGYYELPNKRLITNGAHLHFYAVSNGELRAMPFQEGIYDSGPAFITNKRIAFTSTRDNHTSTVVWSTTESRKGTRIWTVDIDGKNPDLASHHSLSQEQHPYMLKDGRLAYSSWQIFGGLPFRYTNNSAGSHTTIDNLFHIYAQDPDGAGNFPIYGQHSGDHIKSYFGADHKAAHFITQTSDGRVWFADYYRGNNNALGFLVGVIPEPEGQEGIGPHEAERHSDIYAPRDAINFASWTHSDDMPSFTMTKLGSQTVTHPNYVDPLPFAGKLGHPAALPNNGLMMAWGKGACSTVAHNSVFTSLGMPKPPLTSGSGGGVAMNLITSLELDTPGCDVGIYRATQVPSQHPGDLEIIVDSKEWHEIMARAVVPYSAIHGVDHPDIIERADVRTKHTSLETGTPFGLLGAASILDRETHPKDGIHFSGTHQFHLQGTDTIDYTDDDLCGVRILGVMPNRNRNVVKEIANYAGERVTILGEFSVLNRSADGNRIMEASGHPDTSFLVRMPANMPYLMQGVDCDGRTLNTDQTWQSLRPGEQKTCNGCHVHSRPGRTEFHTTFAASSEYSIPRLGEGIVPLLSGKSGNTVKTRTVPGYGMRIEFTQDIKPIFDQHCISCHGGSNPAAGLALDKTGGNNKTQGSTWWCLVADKSQTCVAPENIMATGGGFDGVTFGRPQMTRYIRAFNSRGSLLYWKATNQRADNRTDAQYSDDIDFGSNHSTTISAEELGVLSRWIDIGAPGGGVTELYDTQKPTLHLAAVKGDPAQLSVGTVDLGSGIDPGSLVVCVPDNNGDCNNLAGAAQQHGITTVNMGSLSDPDTEIYARVKDMAGNITEVYRTVGWFQNSDSGTTNTGDNQAPSITISSPAGGSEVSGIIPVQVSYSDNEGVTVVELYVNGQLQTKKTQEPFTFSLDTTAVADNDYTLTARAFDAAGNQKMSSPVTVTVNNNGNAKLDTEAPTINITSPTAGTVSGTLSVAFNYSDNVGVDTVELYVNGQSLGKNNQEPFTFTLDTTTVADGNYTLTANAYDAAGNQGTSPVVSVSVQNDNGASADTEAPTIIITSPETQGTIVSGVYRATFDAYDYVGVIRVELYLEQDGARQLIGFSTEAPFDIDWDTTQLDNGSYGIRARAFDAAGNTSISFGKGVIVDNPIDTEAPTINITSPTAGTVSGTLSVAFNYSDNVAVDAVELYVNGQSLGKNSLEPFTFTLDTTTVVDGDYTLTANAYDAAGNQGTSPVVSVSVQNDNGASEDTEAPTIIIMSPEAQGAVVSGVYRVTFDAYDFVGVTRVELYLEEGGARQLIGFSTEAPFDINWDTTQLENGSYGIRARAFDAAGNTSISFGKGVTVDNPIDIEAPTINITSSTTGTVSGMLSVAFNYSDNVGVDAVELYVNGQSLGKNSQEPFTFTLDTTTVADGNYTLTANAYDAAGNQGTSPVVSVSVQNDIGVSEDTEAPTIIIMSPEAQGTVVSGVYRTTFDAYDYIGVTRVELYLEQDGARQLIGFSTEAPFDIDWDTTQLENGSYGIRARAFDAAGNTSFSFGKGVIVDNSI